MYLCLKVLLVQVVLFEELIQRLLILELQLPQLLLGPRVVQRPLEPLLARDRRLVVRLRVALVAVELAVVVRVVGGGGGERRAGRECCGRVVGLEGFGRLLAGCQALDEPAGVLFGLVDDEVEVHVHRLLALLLYETPRRKENLSVCAHLVGHVILGYTIKYSISA